MNTLDRGMGIEAMTVRGMMKWEIMIIDGSSQDCTLLIRRDHSVANSRAERL